VQRHHYVTAFATIGDNDGAGAPQPAEQLVAGHLSQNIYTSDEINRWAYFGFGIPSGAGSAPVMTLELTDEETAELLKELDGIIDGDRYPLSPRIRTLQAIRAKLRPEPVREPLPTPKRYAPPRAKRRPRG
jgi:hypothetical protein